MENIIIYFIKLLLIKNFHFNFVIVTIIMTQLDLYLNIL